MTKLISLLAIPVFASLIPSCATKPVEHGPSKIRGVKEFTLEPMKMENLVVDDLSESDFRAKMDAGQIQSWEEDKKAIKARFADSVTNAAGESGITISESTGGKHYTIRPEVTLLDTGYYRIPASAAVTRLRIRVTIADPGGETVDETSVYGSHTFDALLAPSTGGRLRTIATEIGERYAKYLKKRTRP